MADGIDGFTSRAEALGEGQPGAPRATGVGPSPDVRRCQAAVEAAHDAVRAVRSSGVESLSEAELAHFVRNVERLRSQVEGLLAVAASIATNPDRRHEWTFSTRAWVRHHCNVSKREARARLQVQRLLDALPQWAAAVEVGVVGVDQLRLMARTYANAAVREAVVELADELLIDALTEPYDRFAEYVSNVCRLADADGERHRAERANDRRDVTMRQLPDGTWRLSGRFGGVQGAEIDEILAVFNDAEYRCDWATSACASGTVDARHDETAGAHADGVGTAAVDDEIAARMARMPRTEPQRRADALHAALLAACGRGDKRAVTTLNLLFDADTYTTTLLGGEHDPKRYRDVICRTQSGHAVNFDEAAGTALIAEIRRVVRNAAGVVTDLGRRRRLFTGGARDAALLNATTCLFPGCDAPIRRVQADHNVEWQHLGASDPDNSGPMCGRHNLLKARRGYTVRRNPNGSYDITDGHGNALG